MDNRTLVAFGMLLALVAFALQKRAVDGNAVEKIVIFLSGGITGAMTPRQPGEMGKPAARAAATALIVIFGLLFLHGCASTGEQPVRWDRCQTGRVIDACNPADYPPLTDILPRSPFPRLLVPIEEAEAAARQPTPDEDAAGKLLRKLGH